MSFYEVAVLVLIGLAAGILSGMFGIGGGVIIVPALVFILGMTQHMAQGTSIGLMLLPIGILAAWNYHNSGNLNVGYGIIIALSFFLGGYLGSKFSLGMSELVLKRSFGVLLMVIAIRMIFFSK